MSFFPPLTAGSLSSSLHPPTSSRCPLTSLNDSPAFTLHFPGRPRVSPSTDAAACLIRGCANIARMRPLGGIMATITHWFGTAGEKKKKVTLCSPFRWQTNSKTSLPPLCHALFSFLSLLLLSNLSPPAANFSLLPVHSSAARRSRPSEDAAVAEMEAAT